ncbi:MAG: inner membrane CreD family protein, partial [Pseudomonadales bacterium]
MSTEGPLRSGMTIRFGLIALIVLTMLIPLAMVRGVTADRQSYFDATLADVAGAWGEAQMLSGPFLVVPETHRVASGTDAGGRTRVRRVSRERVYLPVALHVEMDVRHQIRHRAIYDVPVYTAIARVRGTFAPIDAEAADSPDTEVQANRARLVLGISHTQSIGSATPVTIGEAAYPFAAGAGQPWIGAGVHAELGSLQGRGAIPFSFELVLKGTRQLGFTPVGQDTRVHMRSSWPHPSFEGRYLPERYQVDDQGFEADWQIGALARGL